MKFRITKRKVAIAAIPIVLSALFILAKNTILLSPEEKAEQLQRANYVSAASELSCETLKNPFLSVSPEKSRDLTEKITERLQEICVVLPK